MKFSKNLVLAGVSCLSLVFATEAFAQSTATETVEKVIVKGSRKVGNTVKETGTKTKMVIDQKAISQAAPGQTIIETLNTVPGFNFTNNDAYGSSGGNLRIRGLDGPRISLTVDGVQLNDAGNYAIYTNQQVEPELICQASVSTGATDVDSMSASATGGTVNYNTCKPEDKMSAVVKLAIGSSKYTNGFVRLDSGKFGPWGTKAFLAVTKQQYDTWTREVFVPGELKKDQYNFRIYQDLPNDSFVSLSGHYNENRNIFMFNQTKAQIASRGYDYNSAGVNNVNPSNTGNLRGSSKFNINDKLSVTFDPTYQYVLANGGGVAFIDEVTGRVYGTTTLADGTVVPNTSSTNYVKLANKDYNGDGVISAIQTGVKSATNVAIFNPNNTNTNRVSLTTSAIYKLTDKQTIRLGASFDRGRTKQTGEGIVIKGDLNTTLTPNYFGGQEDTALRLTGSDGSYYTRRNRFSNANVDVYSLEYRGKFFDDALTLSLGLRSQKMTRHLDQRCYSPNNGGFNYLCTTEAPNSTTATADSDINLVTFASSGTTKWIAPYKRTYSFSKTSPNVGLTYRFLQNHQVFASYSEALSSPKTDNYYAVFINPVTNKMVAAAPDSETTTNMELGYRFIGQKVFATATFFKGDDKNRILSAFDPDLGITLDRNVGEVKRDGFEGYISYSPTNNLNLNAGITFTNTEMQENLVVTRTVVGTVVTPVTIATKGKELAETPRKMVTWGATYDFADELHFSVSGKYVGNRFSTDMNDDVAPQYTTWNASMRWDFLPTNKDTYLQFNVINLFDTQYFTSISSTNNALPTIASNGTTRSGSAPAFNVAAPRTFVMALRTKF